MDDDISPAQVQMAQYTRVAKKQKVEVEAEATEEEEEWELKEEWKEEEECTFGLPFGYFDKASRLHNDKIMAPIYEKFRKMIEEASASRKNPTCETNIDRVMATDMGSGQKLWKEGGKNEK